MKYYSEDENTLYLVGQDTNNNVKVAKMVLNTLYDYANDGAWLPMIAADGVPAYIKAVGDNNDGNDGSDGYADMKVTVTFDKTFLEYCEVLFNGEVLPVAQTYTRKVLESGEFTVGLRRHTSDIRNHYLKVALNGTVVLKVEAYGPETSASKQFKSSDYLSGGITLNCSYG